MVELLYFILLVVLTSVGFFSLGRETGIRFPGANTGLCAFSLALGGLMCWMLAGDLRWAFCSPAGMAHLVSYSPALLFVYAAGALYVNPSVQAGSRALLSGLLCLAVIVLLVGALQRPVLQPIQLAKLSLWKGDVCLQSHESSCVPAAAVNLLHLHGMEFSERQLAEFALTSHYGTPPVGSFLAINQAVEGTAFQAAIQLKRPHLDANQPLPILAHVRFDQSIEARPRSSGLYSRLLQGIRARSDGHAIVIVERCAEGWVVVDPAAGRVVWSAEQMTECWSGEGVYLSAK
ncbi:MAG: hypothetical protein SFV81_20550 [Pirellulaceae bacterium]|nr:hypothetical protein [Pirellulaceae bacterium]